MVNSMREKSSRAEILDLRARLENACKIALLKSKGKVNEADVRACVETLESYIQDPEDMYLAEIEAELQKIGIRRSYASRLSKLALDLSKRFG